MEIRKDVIYIPQGSLPSRERGLKSDKPDRPYYPGDVAPFAGAWIEILKKGGKGEPKVVAPFAGAWIEIDLEDANKWLTRVAPFAGAWIEMPGAGAQLYRPFPSRSLRGSVD